MDADSLEEKIKKMTRREFDAEYGHCDLSIYNEKKQKIILRGRERFRQEEEREQRAKADEQEQEKLDLIRKEVENTKMSLRLWALAILVAVLTLVAICYQAGLFRY